MYNWIMFDTAAQRGIYKTYFLTIFFKYFYFWSSVPWDQIVPYEL